MRIPRRVGRVALVPVAAAAALSCWGCGGPSDDLPRQAVRGTVTLDGAPLKGGLIQFQPDQPGLSTAGAAGIADGTYSVAKAEGLVPGKYLVMVTSTPPPTPLPPGTAPGDPVAPPKETIPPQYNAKTKLSAEVTKEGPNKFDFELKSK
jgi:hypothetical protein